MMSVARVTHRESARRDIKLWSLPLGVLIALGLGAWIYQLTQGLVVTGMRDVI